MGASEGEEAGKVGVGNCGSVGEYVDEELEEIGRWELERWGEVEGRGEEPERKGDGIEE